MSINHETYRKNRKEAAEAENGYINEDQSTNAYNIVEYVAKEHYNIKSFEFWEEAVKSDFGRDDNERVHVFRQNDSRNVVFMIKTDDFIYKVAQAQSDGEVINSEKFKFSKKKYAEAKLIEYMMDMDD